MLPVLERLATLLGHAGEGRWERSLQSLAAQWTAAANPEQRQQVIRAVLGMYGGMGSFSDVVLQDAGGVRPEMAEFHSLRSRLWEIAQDHLA